MMVVEETVSSVKSINVIAMCQEHGARLPTGFVMWIRRMYLLDIKALCSKGLDAENFVSSDFSIRVEEGMSSFNEGMNRVVEDVCLMGLEVNEADTQVYEAGRGKKVRDRVTKKNKRTWKKKVKLDQCLCLDSLS
ncbi:hypothetical protein V6N13_061881 [Hibiscus sabdariffa]|uniref:Uncharacterized protein n=2 Tax=Hibiscus sabdariffa TaxID=183260 RepID=A0ABR2BQQ8_9ROSI